MTPIVSARPKRKVSEQDLATVLSRLAMDWRYLHDNLPVPTGGGGRSSNVRAYGHPAEWASDQCRRIADMFWSWHEFVAQLRDETTPSPMVSPYGRRINTEANVVNAAWQYLDPRIGDLLDRGRWLDVAETPVPWQAPKWEWTVDDEAFDELFDLHRHIRAVTKQSNPRYVLPLPCPMSECGLLTLERVSGMNGPGGVAQDFIVCGACGYRANDSHYAFLVKLMLDTQTGGQ